MGRTKELEDAFGFCEHLDRKRGYVFRMGRNKIGPSTRIDYLEHRKEGGKRGKEKGDRKKGA